MTLLPAAWALRIYCAELGVFGAQVACQMTFTSLGCAKASIIVAVMRKLVLLVPLIYIILFGIQSCGDTLISMSNVKFN